MIVNLNLNRGRSRIAHRATKTQIAPRGATRGAFTVRGYAKEETIGFLLWDAARMINRMFRRRVLPQGLTNGHWPFIRELWEHDGLTQKGLADRANMRASTCLAAVRDLEKRGFVMRVPNDSDRRKINVFLTRKGRDTYRRVLPQLKQINKTTTRGLAAAEMETLKALLRRLRVNMADQDL